MSLKKFIFYSAIVLFLLVCVHTLFLNITNISDKISLAGIIINILIAAFIISYFQSKETNSRSIKDYFINEIGTLKNDYNCFMQQIKNDQLNSKEIKKQFKDFSVINEQLDYFLKKEMEMQMACIQKNNRKIHKLITDSYEFNNIYGEDSFHLENGTNNMVIQLHKEFNHHLTSLVVDINKK